MMRALLISGLLICGGVTPYTERGTVDFDTFLEALTGHGKWLPGGQELYVYEAKSGYVPMASGRWVYTDYGWYFQGDHPISALTDHYGSWECSEAGHWQWLPDEHWQPAMVEWRATDSHVGWRPSRMARDGMLVESESRRYGNPNEWIFLEKDKFRVPFTRQDVITGQEAEKLLEESASLIHVYVSWRAIDRPGPDPYELHGVSRPQVQDPAASQSSQMPGLADPELEAILAKLEEKKAQESGGATPKADPQAMGPTGNGEGHKPEIVDPSKEPKKLPVFTIMNLQERNAPLPEDARPNDFFVFRPTLHQDFDGIQKRVELYLRPGSRIANREEVDRVLQAGTLIIDGSTPNPNFPAGSQPPPR
jgi:hypothetical protein